ncbi:MAG: class I SAM-dependent methyltransferase [Cytophagales bacterium]|nr:class I SAM-dependent methyltransferase [Cytophagales bacterium]
MDEHYYTKESSYFKHIRKDIISQIPNKKYNKILEIGAGSGDSLIYIKSKFNIEYLVGIELCEIPDSNQKNSTIDKFIIGNIETYDNAEFNNTFDIIICGDVLEHLIDPWQVMKKIYQWLSPGGVFILSIPNIREIKTMYKILIKGDFKYENDGILDKTHLRFFCKKNIVELITSAQLSVKKLTSTNFYEGAPLTLKVIINKLTMSLFKDIFITQYIIIAEKTDIVENSVNL